MGRCAEWKLNGNNSPRSSSLKENIQTSLKTIRDAKRRPEFASIVVALAGNRIVPNGLARRAWSHSASPYTVCAVYANLFVYLCVLPLFMSSPLGVCGPNE